MVQLIYQTDQYKGIYAKESDGWRMQSGDLPIFYINLGNLNNQPYTGPTYTLNASHHRIFVELQNQDDIIPLITLPAANTCKGRTYYFYVLSNNSSWAGTGAPYEEYGATIRFIGADQYIQLDVPLWANSSARRSSLIPEHRQFAIQSDGTDWNRNIK
ncbi:MAG: hypothetical protein IPO48_13820 [Saprospiraceae bacterium]|nr:hypothetical protein [Saprospiraceae bacterium]